MFARIRLWIILICVPLTAFTCQGLGQIAIDQDALAVRSADALRLPEQRVSAILGLVDAWALRHELRKHGTGLYSTDFEICGLLECRMRRLDISVLVQGDSIRVRFDEGLNSLRSSRSRDLEMDLRAALAREFGENAICAVPVDRCGARVVSSPMQGTN